MGSRARYRKSTPSIDISNKTKGSEITSFNNYATQGEYVDGLRAPLVIHPEAEVHSYDEEFTVVIGDWYHTEYPVLIKQFLSIADPAGAEPIPGKNLLLLLLYHD